jgi:acyl transferase domain-containing protein/acyl carrier protein
MLEVLNQYAHGFVTVPVVLACRKGGVFEALQQAPRSAEELGKELRANLGHLQVALRLFESLGWIDRRADGRFEANASMAKQSLVPEALLTLLRADMDTYLREGDGGLLTPWIDEVRARWGVEDELLANFFDGLLAVPVLALLAKRGGVKNFQQRGFVDLPKGVREEVVSLFEALGYLQDAAGGFQLTAPGNFMFERAMNLGVAESYRPMLAAMDQLIFGDAESVFAHDATEHEAHVGRSINVISSGFQHDRYFAEVDQTLVEIFSREPLSAQPRWVADTGCGDGTFLKRVYETVRNKTPRGKRLAEYPLGLIGIDLNQASLDETARTLSGIDFRMVTGDIGNPAKVAQGLRALGVDPLQVLHIRSFLDHDRPYIAPQDQESLAARSGAHYLGVYADRRGNAIPAPAVVQSLVENLRHWAEVVNDHGLIMLEVHCQDPMVVRKHIDQSESLYFDAIESFSQQLMVEADVALMAAAEAGLFPRRESFRKYPAFLPYCRITLNHFERRPYRVRPARRSDLPSLLRLEEACWLAELRTASEELLRRIDTHSLGQWVIEMDGEIAGAVYSQRIADAGQLRNYKFHDLSTLNEDAGSVIQLLGLNILPEQQHLGLGDQLLDLMLMRAALQGGVRQLVGVTRCKSFDGLSVEELTQYVGQRDASGRPIDPNLRFHHSHGAKILGVVEGYRPEDANNLGTGVLLSYDLNSLLAQEKPAGNGAGTKLADDAQSQLETCLRTLLGPSRQAAFSWNRPLREMGLDSLNLLEFRVILQQTFGKPFSTTFFFSHPTLKDIERYLHESSRKAEPSATTAATERLIMQSDNCAPVESRKKVGENQRQRDEDSRLIAVVGMAARFPGCGDLDSFWEVLENGRNTITEVPGERWKIDEFYSADPDAPGKIISRRGGFLREVDEFDASFFNVSPREAELMDPQHRLLLEMHWEAIEHAGMNANQLREATCGFFVGLSSHDYELLQVANGGEYDLGAHYATGNAASTASGRLGYWFGTRGPAITLDTACSSSLVAVHQAVRSLRSRECNLAMASGVNLILSPRLSIAYSKAGMLSPRGRCSTFDAAADGYVRSEGCAVVVLKRLDDAIRDGDAVLAVIRGSAINQDGASNGLTAPSVPAQTALIRSALADARLNPTDIDYVEAHGTGTQLGDPVEFEALRNVFQADAHRTEPLRLGSVKTNIGHTEAVAGIAGLIKTVLALQHEWMPAHLHFESANSQIDLDSIPARIPVRCEPWRRDGLPLRAGVSSFGFSGTNSHVIVEQAQVHPASAAAADPQNQLLALSAKSESALQALVARYVEWLPNHKSLDLGDICATANAGRAHHDFRVAFSAVTHDDLARSLRTGSQRAAAARRIKSAPRIAFLFTGQGSQYSGMARELFLTEPTFRNTLGECCEILAADLSTPLEKILYSDSSDARLIDETANTQPALFAVEYALARTFQSWGIEPAAVMGHSVGEYVAACVAGVFSLEDGLKLIAARGRLMQSLPREGAMLAILGRAESVIEAVRGTGGTVSIAAFNGPANTVISGSRAAVEALGRGLEQSGARVVPLAVSHAFHSDLMDPILPAFRDAAQRVRFAPSRITFASNLTGDLAGAEVGTADYWVDHVRQPVQFAKAIRALAPSGVDVMLEIGPHPVLSAMGRVCLEPPQSESVQWLHTLTRGVSDREGMVAALGKLYEAGTEIDWQRFYAGHNRSRVHLPSYPWQRKRHWMTLNTPTTKQAPAALEAPADWFYEVQWVPRSRMAEQSPRPAVDFLPSMTLFADSLRRGADALVEDCGIEKDGQALDAIEAAALQYAIGALLKLGLAEAGNEPREAMHLAESLGIAPRHRRLFGRIIEMLIDAGLARQTSRGLLIDQRALANHLEPSAGLAGKSSSNKVEFTLIDRCGASLAAVLRGEEDPLPLLFPGDAEIGAEQLYRDTPYARLYNTLIADAVSEAVRLLPQDRVLRILEVGAGTGGTASYVLDRLQDNRAEYVFTDVSRTLLDGSAERFAGRAFVRYSSLDIESDPGTQGFGPGQFDVIIAANVIHATRDLRHTLDHIRPLLAPRGILLLLEATGSRKWVDLTFGLTTGFWNFTDGQIRPDHPLLNREKWLQLLVANGFNEVEAIGSEDASSQVFDQSLFVMRAPSEAPVSQPTSTASASTKPSGEWLIVADRSPIADALDAQLKSLGDQTALITAAEIFEAALSRSDSKLGNLLDRAQHEGSPTLRGVIHLASLDAPSNHSLGNRELERAHELGCESAVRLAQTILEREWREPPKIWLVTRGAQPVNAADGLPSLSQAPMWGVGKVMALEHPNIWGGLIDLGPDDNVETIVDMLAREVREPDNEDEIAFRAKNRFVARLTSFVPPASRPASFKANASYLITGGLGKIGLKVAQWLVDHGARSLVLVGRTPPNHSLEPHRSSHANGDETARVIESLRGAGAHVEVYTASVTDVDAMTSLFSRFGRDLPPLGGVIHAAGVMETAPIRRMDTSDFESVFPSKTSGAWILHELTREINLDFFVLFSSASSSLGSHGVAAYAAANAFLDALALIRRAQGLPALAINWGWWEGGGSSLQIEEFAGQIGLQRMPAALALDALGRLLSSDRTRATVASVDWSIFRPIHATKRGRTFLSALPPSADENRDFAQPAPEPGETFLSRLRGTSPEIAKELLAGHVRNTVASVLHLDPREPIDETRGFFTLGLDSLMTGELRSRLQKSMGWKLPATIAFEYPTIFNLADYLFRELGLAATPAAALPAEPAVPPITRAGDSLDALEDDEIESILDEELTRVLNQTVPGDNAD